MPLRLADTGRYSKTFLPRCLNKAVAYIRQALDEGVTRGKVTPQQRDAATANLSTAGLVEDVSPEADLLIEAVPEEMKLKIEIFALFDKFAKPDAILASNTSSLSIGEMAASDFPSEPLHRTALLQPRAKDEAARNDSRAPNIRCNGCGMC